MQQQEEDDLELSPEALTALAEFAVQVRMCDRSPLVDMCAPCPS